MALSYVCARQTPSVDADSLIQRDLHSAADNKH